MIKQEHIDAKVVFGNKYTHEIIPFLYKKKEAYISEFIRNFGGQWGSYSQVIKELKDKEVIQIKKDNRRKFIVLTAKGEQIAMEINKIKCLVSK